MSAHESEEELFRTESPFTTEIAVSFGIMADHINTGLHMQLKTVGGGKGL